MTTFARLTFTVTLLASLSGAGTAATVKLRAADGVTVHGTHTPVKNARAVVLLFHQADSNRREYDPIAARLAKEGFASLAIDQRVGGEMFGATNETAKVVKGASYSDVLLDMEAALAWTKRTYPKARVFAVGSSYSAALLFPFAAKHADLAGIAAFSPAEYLEKDTLVRDAARRVRVPVFVTSAKSADEVDAARAIFEATASARKTRFVPKIFGVHGASTLRDDRNFFGGAPEIWAALLKFLRAS